MKVTHVIRRPIVTEKSTLARETANITAFEVAINATKIDIKRAVEQLFETKVADVRTARMHGKVKRQGRFFGRRSDWKKAYVKLAQGQTIDFAGAEK